jgi:hypothetical protein
MSRAPTDLLIERHKPYRQAHERYLRATRARHQAPRHGFAELERELSVAENRDRVALGDTSSRPPLFYSRGSSFVPPYSKQRDAIDLALTGISQALSGWSDARNQAELGSRARVAPRGFLPRCAFLLHDGVVVTNRDDVFKLGDVMPDRDGKANSRPSDELVLGHASLIRSPLGESRSSYASLSRNGKNRSLHCGTWFGQTKLPLCARRVGK